MPEPIPLSRLMEELLEHIENPPTHNPSEAVPTGAASDVQGESV